MRTNLVLILKNDVVITSRSHGSYRLVPVRESNTLINQTNQTTLEAKIRHGIEEYEQCKVHRMRKGRVLMGSPGLYLAYKSEFAEYHIRPHRHFDKEMRNFSLRCIRFGGLCLYTVHFGSKTAVFSSKSQCAQIPVSRAFKAEAVNTLKPEM